MPDWTSRSEIAARTRDARSICSSSGRASPREIALISSSARSIEARISPRAFGPAFLSKAESSLKAASERCCAGPSCKSEPTWRIVCSRTKVDRHGQGCWADQISKKISEGGEWAESQSSLRTVHFSVRPVRSSTGHKFSFHPQW